MIPFFLPRCCTEPNCASRWRRSRKPWIRSWSPNYKACLLGLVNVDAGPAGLMNILLSSASNHPWNPAEKSPETSWEAEIDRLMLAQASTADRESRKKSFDRVQQILHEQNR